MRVLAMTMIIAFHSVCFYSGRWTKVDAIYIPIWAKVMEFLDAIDLNMFVFISGYLYGYLYIYRNKYRHPAEVIRNKAIRLLLPYCFWGVFMVTVFSGLYPWHELFYGVSHLWFLLMLFGVFTLTVVLQLVNSQRFKFTPLLGVALIVLGYVSWYVFSKFINPKDFLCATRVLSYFPAFMVGYLGAKVRIGWWMPGWAFLVLPLSLLVLVILVWYPVPLPYGAISLLKMICAYSICVSLLIILSKVTMPRKLHSVVQELERLSLGIYIFNQISMDAVFVTPVLHSWFGAHWVIGPFLLFLIGSIPPLFLSLIFNKYKVLRWTIGG